MRQSSGHDRVLEADGVRDDNCRGVPSYDEHVALIVVQGQSNAESIIA